MKLTSVPFSVAAEYFGNLLSVPKGTKHIAIDENSEVWAYPTEQRPTAGKMLWSVAGCFDMTKVGIADLEGMDWKDTLMTLNTESKEED